MIGITARTTIGQMRRIILHSLPTSLAGMLRASRVRRLIHDFEPRVVRHVYGGETLAIHLTDPLAQGWYDHDWEEPPELAELRLMRLRRDVRVFDIGAHQGVVALMLAKVVGPQGLVVAVEANKHNAEMAERNCELNDATNVVVVQAAASAVPGMLIFNAGLNGQIDDGTGAGGRVSVPAVTIDGLAARFGDPDVVILDVEGAEGLALKGATRVLRAGAHFVVEVHTGCGLEKLGGSVKRLLECFPTAQFTLLARREDDATFQPLTVGSPLTTERFFLLARLRDCQEMTDR